MARRSIWGTLLNALKGLTGVGQREAPPSVAPGGGMATPPPPPPSSPPEEGGAWEYYQPGNVTYSPQHETFWPSFKYGKIYIQTVKGRWTVGNEISPADISDVRDLIETSNKGRFVTLIVNGRYYTEYPGQEGRSNTWLSYVYPRGAVDDALNDPDMETATDFMNELVAPFGESWDEVYEIQVLDT